MSAGEERSAASCPENDPLCDGEMVTPPGEPGYSYPCPARSAPTMRDFASVIADVIGALMVER